MDQSATEKLERLKTACTDKVHKIGILKATLAENSLILESEIRSSCPQDVSVGLKAKQITFEEEHVKSRSRAVRLERIRSQLIHKIQLLQHESMESYSKIQELLDSLPRERKSITVFRMSQHVFAGTQQERWLMAQEEVRSLQMAITEEHSTCKRSGRQDWYSRLVTATQIQRQEAERALTEQEQQYWTLSRAAAAE